RNGAVAADSHKGVRREGRRMVGRGRGPGGGPDCGGAQREAEHQPARTLHETAAADIAHRHDRRDVGSHDGMHECLLCQASARAASWMAARMRTYVAQRHTLPLIALSMSASVGWGFCASRAAADMICPDWQ